ncbi:MAG: MFS transporter, partial [Dehalococcoidia bacterium]
MMRVSERHGAGGGARRWLHATFSALSNRHYRTLLIGSGLAFVGFMMATTAQNVVAYDLTGNNRAVGTVQFGQGVAMLLLAPVAGALADRLSKRLVLLVCQGLIGATMLGLGVLVLTGHISVFWLAAGAFVMGVMFSFLGPARQAFVGEIVEPERRGNAVALSQVSVNLSRVVGPFIAGALIAWPRVGTGGSYLIMAAIYVFVLLTLAQLPPAPGRGGRGGDSVLAATVLGVRHIFHNPPLRRTMLGFFLMVTVAMPYMV